MFVNYTNHPSAKWSAEQLAAAAAYGSITDMPFPSVPPDASEEAVARLAETEAEKIVALKPAAVLCQGEFTLCYAILNILKKKEIKALAACSTREVTETVQPDGTTRRTAVFRFVQYREYK